MTQSEFFEKSNWTPNVLIKLCVGVGWRYKYQIRSVRKPIILLIAKILYKSDDLEVDVLKTFYHPVLNLWLQNWIPDFRNIVNQDKSCVSNLTVYLLRVRDRDSWEFEQYPVDH